jgi:spore coat polysaccharide biosynthesis protein SpsF
MKQGILIFARMSATRLPGKVLLPFAGRPLLLWIHQRALHVGVQIAIATSTDDTDAPIAETARAHGIACYRGSLHDVLARAHFAALEFGLTHIGRLCADRPFFSIEQLRAGFSALYADSSVEFASNNLHASAPPGLTTEVISQPALAQLHACADQPLDREHLTRFIYRNRNYFRCVEISPDAFDAPVGEATAQSWAVDTHADYLRLSALAAAFEPDVALSELLSNTASDVDSVANANASMGKFSCQN